MKKLYTTLVAVFAISQFSYAQWTTSGSNIYNSNTGNVGIGTSSPTAPLNVAGGGITTSLSDIATTVTARFNTANPPITLGIGYVSSDNPFLQAFNSTLNVTNSLIFNPFGGNVGIGTAYPATKLDVQGGNMSVYNNSNPSYIVLGSVASGKTNLNLGTSADANGSGVIQSVSVAGSAYGNTLINPDGGNVAIGTIDPHGYKLAVNGNAIATSMTVKLYSAWPDYVFKPTYKLPSLSAVKTYIEQNQHLPEMPSAQEVEKNGLNLGEMVKLQAKKIEELTLYLIEQQQRIDRLEKQLNKPINH
jgi:hypothetical protein